MIANADRRLRRQPTLRHTGEEVTLGDVERITICDEARRTIPGFLEGRQEPEPGATEDQAFGVVQPPLAASLHSASLTCAPQVAPWPCSPASDNARWANRRSGEAPCQCIVSGGILTVWAGFSTWCF